MNADNFSSTESLFVRLSRLMSRLFLCPFGNAWLSAMPIAFALAALVEPANSQDKGSTPQPSAAPPAEEKVQPVAIQSTAAPVGPATTVVTPLTIDQIRANLPATSAERFEFLRRQRKITLEAIDEASSQLKSLTTSIALLQKQKDALSAALDEEGIGISKEELDQEKQRAANDLSQAQQALKAAKADTHAAAAELDRLQTQMEEKEQRVSRLDAYMTRVKAEEKRRQENEATARRVDDDLNRLSASRDKISQSQLSYQRLLGEIDDIVNQLFISSDATNSFKLKMSIAFAIMVAIVITGFFWIAFSNEDVKKAIFSNEAGIQFITLFSLVIAVILFGIIGILESKELSALLGGLSGYILGKARS